MNKLLLKGNSNELVVTFHGTGGNLYSLLYITGEINPNDDVLLVEGQVGSGKNRRFFEPLKAGRIDLESVELSIKAFMKFWNELDRNSYNSITFMGYSNGANFVLAILEHYPDVANNYILLHASNLNWKFNKPLDKKQILITQGANDTLSLAGDVLKLSKELEHSGAEVNMQLLDSRHEVTDNELEVIKTWNKRKRGK